MPNPVSLALLGAKTLFDIFSANKDQGPDIEGIRKARVAEALGATDSAFNLARSRTLRRADRDKSLSNINFGRRFAALNTTSGSGNPALERIDSQTADSVLGLEAQRASSRASIFGASINAPIDTTRKPNTFDYVGALAGSAAKITLAEWENDKVFQQQNAVLDRYMKGMQDVVPGLKKYETLGGVLNTPGMPTPTSSYDPNKRYGVNSLYDDGN